MEKKIISVSEKRQITLPIQFYNALNIGKEVECSIEGGRLILTPIRREENYFASEILADIIAEGVERDQIVKEFNRRSAQMGPAVRRLIEETEQQSEEGKLASFEDIFGEPL